MGRFFLSSRGSGGGGGGGVAIGGAVTGGTTGSVLFVGSGPVLAQDNTNFFWDDTNNRLGIGTASPGYALDVASNGRMRHQGGVGAGFWYNGVGTAAKWFVGTDAANDNLFNFYAGATIFSLPANDSQNPAFQCNQNTGAVNANAVFLNLLTTILQNSTSGYTILAANVTDFATGSGDKRLIDLKVDTTTRFKVERGRLTFAYHSLSADTTLDDTHHTVFVDASGAARTITLPAASGRAGIRYEIKKIDSSVNAVTVDGNSSETIDGATTQVLAIQYQSITIVCDGTGWGIV